MSSAMVCRLLRVTLMPMSARSLLRAVASRKKYFPQSDGHCAVSSRLASTDLLYWAYRRPPVFELTKATVIGTFGTFAGFAGFAGRAAAGRAGVFAGMPHPDRAPRDRPAAMATASSRLGAAIPY